MNSSKNSRSHEERIFKPDRISQLSFHPQLVHRFRTETHLEAAAAAELLVELCSVDPELDPDDC